MSQPRNMDVAFVYKHYFTGQVIVRSLDGAHDISKSRGRHDWIHVNTIDPVIVLDRIVQAKGRERANIIRRLGIKP